MSHDVFDLIRPDASSAHDVPDQRRLRLSAGRGNAVGVAIVVDAGSANHRMDRIAVNTRSRQRLENQRNDRLAGHHTVGHSVEGSALPERREHSGFTQHGVRPLRQNQIDAGHDRRITLSRPETRARLV